MTTEAKKTFSPIQFLWVILIIFLSSKWILISTFSEITILIYTLLAFYCLGYFACYKSTILNILPLIIQIAFNIVLGGILFSFFVMAFNFAGLNRFALISLCSIPIFFGLWAQKQYVLRIRELLYVFPFLLLLYDKHQYALASNNEFINVYGDYFYYSAVTKSLSIKFSIFDSVFHQGIPLSYQTIPFFFPAIISLMTGIKSHLVLWGIAMPLYGIFGFGTLSVFIERFVFTLYPKLSGKRIPLILFICISIALLAPLNFQYLIKGDIEHFILWGQGYILPLVSPCLAFGIWLFAILCFFFLKPGIDLNKWDIFYGGFLLGVLCVTKLSLFIPVFIFFGLLFLSSCFLQKKILFSNLFYSLLLGGLFGLLLYKVFFISSPTYKINIAEDGGYFMQIIRRTLHSKGFNLNFYNLICGVFILWISWLGIKLFLLFYLKNKELPNDLKQLIRISFLGLLISSIPAFTLDYIAYQNENGKILQNMRFDTMQFIQGALFIITPFTIVWLIIMFLILKNRFIIITSSIWLILTTASLILFTFKEGHLTLRERTWTRRVKDEHHKLSPSLMAMQSFGKYSCQVLVCNDVYPWWTFGEKAAGRDYVMSDKVSSRGKQLREFLDPGKSIEELKKLALTFKNEGVDFLVATPNDLKVFEVLEKKGVLHREKNSTWFFRIK